MEISQYLSIARRWAWLLILGLVLGVAIGYGVAKLQTPIYQASTRVIASRASMQAASNSGASATEGFYYISDQQLMQTYIELLKSSSIFDKTSQTLGYPVSSGQVQAAQVNDTRILSISVEDTNPRHAAEIANAVVQALILQNEEIEASRYKSSDENLQTQIKLVEDQIATYQTNLDSQSSISLGEQLAQVEAQMAPLQAEVTQLKKDIAILTPTFSSERKAKVAELQARLDQIKPLLDLYQKIYTDLVVVGTSGTTQNDNAATTRLQSTLVLYQQIYLNLINTREAIRLSRLQNSQSINQIQVAAVPERPIRPQPLTTALLAGIIGLMLAAGIVFLIEYMDDTLKVPEDVNRVLELPLIGYVADMETNISSEPEVYVFRQPRSPISEAFRSLRTNLEFAAVDKPLRIILVTGAEAGDGKSTIATNLAAIFAQGGKRVMLLDCDLRRPRVHRFLGLQNRVGMTDLFRDNLDVEAVTQQWAATSSMSISVITSGSLPPNPAELLGSKKMDHILAEIANRVDVIVIDSPPSLVSDAQVLAAKVDGVLLVLQPGKTHMGAAIATREQLERAGAHVVGAVFNRIPRQRGYYYGGYRYYSSNYYQNEKYLNGIDINPESGQRTTEVEGKTPPRSLMDRLFKSESIRRHTKSKRRMTFKQEKKSFASLPDKVSSLEDEQAMEIQPASLMMNFENEKTLTGKHEILSESFPDDEPVIVIDQDESMLDFLSDKVFDLENKPTATEQDETSFDFLSDKTLDSEGEQTQIKQETPPEFLLSKVLDSENELMTAVEQDETSFDFLSDKVLDSETEQTVTEQETPPEFLLSKVLNSENELMTAIEQDETSFDFLSDKVLDSETEQTVTAPEFLLSKVLDSENELMTAIEQDDISFDFLSDKVLDSETEQIVTEQETPLELLLSKVLDLENEPTTIEQDETSFDFLSNKALASEDEPIVTEQETPPEFLLSKLLNPKGWQTTAPKDDHSFQSTSVNALDSETEQAETAETIEQKLFSPESLPGEMLHPTNEQGITTEQKTSPGSLLKKFLKTDGIQRLVQGFNSKQVTAVEQEAPLESLPGLDNEQIPAIEQEVSIESLPTLNEMEEEQANETQSESLLNRLLKKEVSAAISSVPTTNPGPLNESLPPMPAHDTTLSASSESVETVDIPLKYKLNTLIGTDYKFVIHKSLKDEDLEFLAHGCDTSVEAILAINHNLKYPISTDTIVIIPFGFTVITQLPSFMAYEVLDAGDTVESLAQKLRVDPLLVKYYNNINAREQLLAGSWLLIPSTKAMP